MTFKFASYRKYLPIFGGFLLHLSVGCFFSIGHIKPHIDEYMGNNNNTKSSTWIVGSTLIGMGAAMSLGGYLQIKIGSSLTVLIGGWIMSANVCLMWLTMKCGLAVVILTYGLFAGFGIGLVYGVALGVPLKIVKNHIGLFLGVIVSGFGVSAIVFNFLQNYISGDSNQNFPLSFLILGCIYAVIQLIGGILIKENENGVYHNELLIESKETSFGYFGNNLVSKNNLDFKPHEILLELDFWILWIILFLNAICINLITCLYNKYFEEPHHFNQMVKIFTSGAAFNCLGRIFWGFIIDIMPFEKTMVIMTMGTSILMALFASISFMGISGNNYKIVFGIVFCAINFFQSGNFCVFPFLCARLYGTKYFVCNYGLLFTACSAAGTIVNIILTTTSVNKEFIKISFFTGAAMSILSAVMTLVYRGKSLIIRTNFLSIP